jgi:hypothetical protein
MLNIDVNKEACMQQLMINSQGRGSSAAQPEATAGSAVNDRVLIIQARSDQFNLRGIAGHYPVIIHVSRPVPNTKVSGRELVDCAVTTQYVLFT